MFRIAVDPIFPPPAEFSRWNGNKKESIPENVL